jgi:choice-of-anchor A domain-containing protein
LSNGPYSLPTLRLNSSEKMLVTGHAVLYVAFDISIVGSSSSIVIAPDASLTLYIAAPTASIGGNGIVNQAGYATNCLVYGLPTCTRIDIQGNGTFKGCIYAPQASLTLNGSGSGQDDFIGAAAVKSMTLNGHFNFHYDEALQCNAPFIW